jgi:hypothetical protein
MGRPRRDWPYNGPGLLCDQGRPMTGTGERHYLIQGPRSGGAAAGSGPAGASSPVTIRSPARWRLAGGRVIPAPPSWPVPPHRG